MTTIEVDFEVYKALTVRRRTESTTYNDVLRELLKLRAEPDADPAPVSRYAGCTFKGVVFPDGTQFRATYKGQTYTAHIQAGRWWASDGGTRNSPSEAAVRITGKSWNGWRFWQCKRPGDKDWRLMENVRAVEGGR